MEMVIALLSKILSFLKVRSTYMTIHMTSKIDISCLKNQVFSTFGVQIAINSSIWVW
jgi:hypothetical protein